MAGGGADRLSQHSDEQRLNDGGNDATQIGPDTVLVWRAEGAPALDAMGECEVGAMAVALTSTFRWFPRRWICPQPDCNCWVWLWLEFHL